MNNILLNHRNISINKNGKDVQAVKIQVITDIFGDFAVIDSLIFDADTVQLLSKLENNKLYKVDCIYNYYNSKIYVDSVTKVIGVVQL